MPLRIESFALAVPRPSDARAWAAALEAAFAERGWRVIRHAVVGVEAETLRVEGARLCAS